MVSIAVTKKPTYGFLLVNNKYVYMPIYSIFWDMAFENKCDLNLGHDAK